MRSPLTTLCYVEKDDSYLMLHRVSKKHDVNKDKWIGIGGHFEEGESPEECLLREAMEETGLRLTSFRFRAIVTFIADGWPPEYMCLYTADGFEGELTDCNEGKLEWVKKAEVTKLKLWEGDKIFLKLIAEEAPFFSLKLMYQGDVLKEAVLDGKPLELFDICDTDGNPTGETTERSVAHTLGTVHRTVHTWVVRQSADDGFEVLLQKRSLRKDSFPGCYDTSSAGHIQAGDEPLPSAIRELSEELGIEAQEEDLTYIGRFDSGEILANFDGRPFHDREIGFVYVYQKPVEIGKLLLQEDEVDAVEWMPYEKALEAVKRHEDGYCIKDQDLELVGAYLGRKTDTRK